MAGPPAPTPGRGRLVLVLLGLAAAGLIAWLLLRTRPPVEPVQAPPAAERPVAYYLARADAARGEAIFVRCAACHTARSGMPHGLGPDLWAAMGSPVAGRADYAYSAALRARGGAWDWAAMDRFLADPRAFAPGTRMAFAGVSKPQDRADLMLWLNRQGGTLTAPPAAR